MISKETYKTRLLIILSALLALSLALYFNLHNTYPWATDILPEFIGFTILAITITYALKRATSLTSFFAIFGLLLAGCVFGYIYGITYEIYYLIDLMPEFIGPIAIGLLFSFLFRKKMFV